MPVGHKTKKTPDKYTKKNTKNFRLKEDSTWPAANVVAVAVVVVPIMLSVNLWPRLEP